MENLKPENMKKELPVRLDCLLYGLFCYFSAREEKINAYRFSSEFKGWYGINLNNYLNNDEINFMLKERDLYR
jgi:hypothetical protein